MKYNYKTLNALGYSTKNFLGKVAKYMFKPTFEALFLLKN